MDTSDSENDVICTPTDVLEVTTKSSMKLLPKKSKKQYEAAYKTFVDWQSMNKANPFSEEAFLEYFGELSKKYKSSSLWALYSMLRSTVNINNNINIENYTKLRALLKRKAVGYQAKKPKTFTLDDIQKFIDEAPDNIYLSTKVALIMGITGACRTSELHSMNIEHVQDLGSAALITVPNIKTFTITGDFYTIFKNYADLRPTDCTCPTFFLNYQNGKCTPQNIGINKFRKMGKQVAKFLKLPNPELYTTQSFRRSSASLFGNACGNIIESKRYDGCKSTSDAEGSVDNKIDAEGFVDNKTNVEGYIDNKIDAEVSIVDKVDTANKISQSDHQTYTVNTSEIPAIHFENCSNITINVITKSDTEK